MDKVQKPSISSWLMCLSSNWQYLVCTGSHDCMNPSFFYGFLMHCFVCLFVRNINFWDRKSIIFDRIGEMCHEHLQNIRARFWNGNSK